MTDCPWQPSCIHGVIGWNVLHHNRPAALHEAVARIYRSLIPSGILMVTLKSDKADFAGQGVGIESGTFIHDIGDDSGVSNHYFNEADTRDLFANWEFMVPAEQVIAHLERPHRFWEYTPFHSHIGGLSRESPRAIVTATKNYTYLFTQKRVLTP